jgi:hypothetical protein
VELRAYHNYNAGKTLKPAMAFLVYVSVGQKSQNHNPYKDKKINKLTAIKSHSMNKSTELYTEDF